MPLPKYITVNNAFQSKYGINLQAIEQGSEEWMLSKLGVLSASNAQAIIAKADSLTRASYMSDLVAQIATGIFPEINAKAMAWGKDHEDAARASYEFAAGVKMVQLSFVFKDDTFRVGCSADGLVSDKKGAEIKCPFNTANYIQFLCMGKIKPEWKNQVNMCMWVMGIETWDIVQYDPRMKSKPLHIVTVERDEALFKTFEDAVPKFIEDMDKMLETVGVKYGEQWERLQLKKAVS
jgi:hypothetical protein